MESPTWHPRAGQSATLAKVAPKQKEIEWDAVRAMLGQADLSLFTHEPMDGVGEINEAYHDPTNYNP